MLMRCIPSKILKSYWLINNEVRLLQTYKNVPQSSQILSSPNVLQIHARNFACRSKSSSQQGLEYSSKVMRQNLSKFSSTSESALSQLSEVVTQLLSMQGRTVGGLKDKVVVSSITQEKAAYLLCKLYSELDNHQRTQFLIQLAVGYEIDNENVKKVAAKLAGSEGTELLVTKLYQEMKSSLVPPQNLAFSKIGQIQGGVKFLVDLRKDVIETLRDLDPTGTDFAALKLMNSNLQSLLSYWFSMGFMAIEQVTWNSPCALLQKVSDYEAVHPVKNWNDLKTRVGPYRRCFVYTHPSMPGEPVVILHVALTETVSSSITSLVRDHRSVKGFDKDQSWAGYGNTTEDPELCKAAIFYSVTSTQTGLQGIELGTHLIKQAVVSLKREFPNLKTFSTLSPIPGFRAWLALELTKAARGESNPLSEAELSKLKMVLQTENVCQDLLTVIKNSSWVGNKDLEPEMKNILTRLCARYLYIEKRRNNALNSVANFHLRNGSCLWRINWLADPSPRGMTNSCGLMVNYRYYLDRLEENSNNYLNKFNIDADVQVVNLLTTKSKL
eukprot:GFUD01019808.1.p1 GENE.GFUD01019808.1~~GFUD01019808.1.p1  ORF type:complete len:555 (-),score=121.10 GFUD01019808.1:174-1838(-)